MNTVIPLKIRIDIDLSTIAPPLWIGATIFAPRTANAAVPAVMFCFPGGGMTQLYFNLRGASFAQAMTAVGITVVTFDHLGIGESASVPDGFGLTAAIVAQAGSQASLKMIAHLKAGTTAARLPPMPGMQVFGVGHSMGGMIVTLQQESARPYAGLALLGFSTRGLPEVLTPEEKSVGSQSSRTGADYVRLAHARFGEPLAHIPARMGGSAVLQAASAPLLTVAAIQSMLPGNIAAEAALIDVPVFLAVGDRDIAGRPERIPEAFAIAPERHLLVMPDAGHHPFIAPSAAQLYGELSAWALEIASRP